MLKAKVIYLGKGGGAELAPSDVSKTLSLTRMLLRVQGLERS